ncbi:hypothetical protein, partial [Fervidobacterium sp.]
NDRVYFILFSLKPKDDKGKYTYEYEYAKRQDKGDGPKIFLPVSKRSGRKGQITSYIPFDYEIFEKWLTELIGEITEKGNFVPIFLDDRMKSFINLATKEIGESEFELVAPEGSKKTRTCRTTNPNGGSNCPYEPICSMFEIHGVKLKKG